MAYEQRSGDIAVFKETDKKNEKGPDWKGTMIVPEGAQPGDKLEVAFWAKGDRGTMLAGSAKPSRSQGDRRQVDSFRGGSSGEVSRSGNRSQVDDPFGDDSEIPF